MLVVDACVAVKWYLKEDQSLEAAELLSGSDVLIAPPNINDEIIESLLRAGRQNRIPIADSIQLIEKWHKTTALLAPRIYTMTELVPDQFIDRAVQYSIALKHSYYDCQYLALAEIQQCPVITADHQFYQRAKPHYDKIILLGKN